jgi:hypothetical protein
MPDDKKPLSDDEILSMLDDLEVKEKIEAVSVSGASGSEFRVLNVEEAAWFEESLQKYTQQYSFENVADLQDLDRLLSMELLSYRWANWMIRDSDYDGASFDEKSVSANKDKMEKSIVQLKAHLGIGRKNRVESEQQSVADYMTELLRRAEEFGVHRDTQNAEILNWFMELRARIGLHDRSDDEERTHNKVHLDQIIEWIRDELIPAVDKIDDHFRENQKYWIKDL